MQPGADPRIQLRGRNGERFARAYNGGLGGEPQQGAGAEPLCPCPGVNPPKAEKGSLFDAPRRAEFGLLSKDLSVVLKFGASISSQ